MKNLMKYMLFSISLICIAQLNGKSTPLTTFQDAVDIPNKALAQAAYMFITDEDEQDEAAIYYADTKKLGTAADLKKTPTTEAEIGARFIALMTAPNEPGTALSAKFSKKLVNA